MLPAKPPWSTLDFSGFFNNLFCGRKGGEKITRENSSNTLLYMKHAKGDEENLARSHLHFFLLSFILVEAHVSPD